MRRALSATVVLALAISVSPVAARGKKPAQRVEGTILTSAASGKVTSECDIAEGVPQAIAQGGLPTGATGYSFAVDPNTYGKRFRLTTATAGADVDIFFHEHVGSQTEPLSRPPTVAYATDAIGGEAGIVPRGFTHAIVCAYYTEMTSFVYDAGGSPRS